MNKYKDPVQSFLLAPQLRLLRHLGLWVLIILLTVGIVDSNVQDGVPVYKWIILTCMYISIFAGNFYLTAYFAVTKFLAKNRLFHYLLFVIGIIVIDMALALITIRTLLDEPEMSTAATAPSYFQLIYMINSVVSVGLIVAGLSTILLLRYWIVSNDRKLELEASTLHSELNNLKKQINPHFLFNMLNNAHVLIRKKRPEASEILFKLEDLLRYQIEDSSNEFVELNSDMQFLQDFLNLEKIRRDEFEFTVCQEGYIRDVLIPPLLFIPFVENAVKYSQDSNKPSSVELLFKVENGLLTFRSTNTKPEGRIRKNATGGLGLKNIRRRLELIYPGKHTLFFTEEKLKYTVTLTIQL